MGESKACRNEGSATELYRIARIPIQNTVTYMPYSLPSTWEREADKVLGFLEVAHSCIQPSNSNISLFAPGQLGLN